MVGDRGRGLRPPREFRVHIGDRTVCVKTGPQTQTVNVCAEANREGEYEHTVRLSEQHFVDEATLNGYGCTNPEDLVQVLRDRHHGKVESGPLAEPQSPPDSAGSADDRFASDPWVQEAVPCVDRAIDALMLEFVRRPYLHRVEHSLHCDLYRLLTDDPILGQLAAGQGYTTRLVHKEWPEHSIRESKGRRGNSDLAVLSPKGIASCSREAFLDGRIEPPIVIEAGLNYESGHLQNDLGKLMSSHVHRGYLLHLVNKDIPDDYRGLEQLLLDIEQRNTNIRTAYARVTGQTCRYKMVSSREVADGPVQA